MSTTLETELVVPNDHPSLPGHFPGRPVVPGVVLLELVRGAIPGGANWRLQSVPAAKFLRPVLPGERVALRLELEGSGGGTRVRFRAHRGEELVCDGTLLFSTEPA
jgi:3-hydroxymyristoyl/3-hydroxydecanoyl-(acyl carrier protein) dehydratase